MSGARSEPGARANSSAEPRSSVGALAESIVGSAQRRVPAASSRARLAQGELEEWGAQVGRLAGPPLFIGLRGPLGAGKSVLARAVARAMGVGGALPSPTFNLLFRYDLPDGRGVVHADLFRVESTAELWELGWRELLGDPDAVALVEWCERAGDELPPDRWEVGLQYVPGVPGVRDMEVVRFGKPAALPALS